MIQLDDTNFAKLFPFFLEVNNELNIIKIGPSFEKICGNVINLKLKDAFQFVRPKLSIEFNFNSILSHLDHLIILECKVSKFRFRGQFIHQKNTQTILYINSPWFEDIKDLEKNNLSITDFALHDTITDNLHLLRSKEITQSDLINLNKDLDKKVKERTSILNQSLKEKEILLDEIHHRVKNNLQVVIGLMNLQQNTYGDSFTKDLLKTSERRLKAMSLIHELIYQKRNYKEINMNEYIESLFHYISESYSDKRVYLNKQIEQISLSISTATSLGIILTEIMSNSFKYAFIHAKQNAEIFIKVTKLNDAHLSVIINDNGEGFELKTNFQNKTLGMTLINGLVQQINGKIELNSNKNGTEYIIEFVDNKK